MEDRQIHFRIDVEAARMITELAKREGMSLNAYCKRLTHIGLNHELKNSYVKEGFKHGKSIQKAAGN